MDRYICNKCGATFRHYGINVNVDKSESVLVDILSAYCPKCASFDIELTEHGKLLADRRKKIEHLNQINEK